MQIHDEYPWSELVAGTYVWDAEGVPWKLTEAHPTDPGVFKAASIEGKVAVLRDPGKPVRAMVPDYEEAMSHLRHILGARLDQKQLTMAPLPTTTSKTTKMKIKAHLINMHDQYMEPSQTVQNMLECHAYLHEIGQFGIPHTHGEKR